MWISKKKWKELEKRVADLEEKVQSQPNIESLAEKLSESLKKISENTIESC